MFQGCWNMFLTPYARTVGSATIMHAIKPPPSKAGTVMTPTAQMKKMASVIQMGLEPRPPGSRIWLLLSYSDLSQVAAQPSVFCQSPHSSSTRLGLCELMVFYRSLTVLCMTKEAPGKYALAFWEWEEALAVVPGAMQQPGSPTYLELNIAPRQLLITNFPTELRRFFSFSSDR